MVREPIEAEEIGVLLDGTAGEERRDALLARLAADDDDYELFADTAAVLRELEEDGVIVPPAVPDVLGETPARPMAVVEDAPAQPALVPGETPPRWASAAAEPNADASAAVGQGDVIQLRPRRATRWRGSARWMAAAAAVAAVALVPLARSRSGGAYGNPERLVSVGGAPASLPADLNRPWNATVLRGPGGTADPNGVAARVGALHMDLVVAANTAERPDPVIIARIAHDAATTLQRADDTAADLVAPSYRDIGDSAAVWPRAQLLSHLHEAGATAKAGLVEDHFALGAWTEAARLAANRQDAAFFRAPESRRALAKAAELPDLGADAAAALTRITAVRASGEVRDWDSLKVDLYKLQNGLTR